MSSGEPLVSYRCTIEACRGQTDARPGRALPSTLELSGCAYCGCKVLEILDDPELGHIKVDWRSQKSARKKRGRTAASVRRRAEKTRRRRAAR